jgi:imidazoleglycerol-phosphate dehydratase
MKFALCYDADMARISTVTRVTNETNIALKLNIDGTGNAQLDIPIGFMAHMISAFCRHGLFDLDLKAKGDLEVDQHHLVEDTGIALGQAFYEALGDKQGISRNGFSLFPMDETLARAAVDISGRPYLVFNGCLSGALLGTFQTDVIEDFFQAFVSSAKVALHLDIIRGRSDHHKIEALFKAFARAMRQACAIDPRAPHSIPSTKGIIA